MAVSRKSPFWLPEHHDAQSSHLSDHHVSALYSMGEYVMFVLMWQVSDFKAGLVGRCPTCYGARQRVSEAYKQAPDSKCLDCFGTTLEGGYRARIVRPALVSDSTSGETKMAKRGEVTTDALTLETTTDFFSRTGDYLIRADGTRYQLQEMTTLVVRSGFGFPSLSLSVGGLIPGARLEDVSSVVYKIPPSPAEANALLSALALDRHTPRDVTAEDVVRTNGYLIAP